jgi:RNA ligase (TIGR02306 family)
MERERKLASIQRITELRPIDGADKIELATVLGWHVVVGKGAHKVGDLVVYCEVDSLLPLKEEFDFLGNGNKPKRQYIDGKEIYGHRIKTMRLRGQVSQGIVFPLTILAHGNAKGGSADYLKLQANAEALNLPEGTDVTEYMGIYKYEMPLPTELAGKARGGWPGFMPKTDEPRLQANPGILEKYKGVTFYATEKIDGSSITLFIKNDEMHCAGRTIDWLDDGGNTIWRVAKELDIEAKLRAHDLDEHIALQGEIYGPGIQGNPLKASKATIRFYNAYDWVEGKYLDYLHFVTLMAKLGLETVPVITDSFKLLPTVDEMVIYASRNSVINPNVKLEGIVLRPLNEQRDADLGRLSFKVISPEYLLKHES